MESPAVQSNTSSPNEPKRRWWKRGPRVDDKVSAFIIAIVFGIGEGYWHHQHYEHCQNVPAGICDVKDMFYTVIWFGALCIIPIVFAGTQLRHLAETLMEVTGARERCQLSLQEREGEVRALRRENAVCEESLRTMMKNWQELDQDRTARAEQIKNFDLIAPLFSGLIKDIWVFEIFTL